MIITSVKTQNVPKLKGLGLNLKILTIAIMSNNTVMGW